MSGIWLAGINLDILYVWHIIGYNRIWMIWIIVWHILRRNSIQRKTHSTIAILEMSLDFFNVKAHQTMCMGSWWQSRIKGLLSLISLLKKLHQDTLSQSVRFHFHPFSFSILFLSFQIFQMIRMQTASIIFDPPCRPRFRRVLATARWSWPPCEHVDGSWWSQIILIFHVSQLIFRESQPRNWSTQVTLKAYPAIFFQMSWKNPSAQQQAILLLVDLQSPLQEVTLRRWANGGPTWTNMDQPCRIWIHGIFLGIVLGILWTNMD